LSDLDLGFIVVPASNTWPIFDSQAEAEAHAEDWLLNGQVRAVVICEIKTRAKHYGIVWERGHD
jgi:hypothetical protein